MDRKAIRQLGYAIMGLCVKFEPVDNASMRSTRSTTGAGERHEAQHFKMSGNRVLDLEKDAPLCVCG
jgi:hypothetical protein